MKTFCITCPELPDTRASAEAHFKEMDVQAEFVDGIHAETFGILAWRPYRVDNPKEGKLVPMSQTGLCLSHYLVWSIIAHLPSADPCEEYMILEEDAQFPPLWKWKLKKFMEELPMDWDIALPGNSNCSDKPSEQIKGSVWEVKYPFCTHAYIIRRKALPVLLAFRDAAMKIDVGLITQVYPKLCVYTCLPRIIGQHGLQLME